MNANMKKKKISVLRIILCAFIIVFIVVFLIIIKMKMEGIHILSGSVTTTFLDTEYDDGTFLISVGNRLYMDPFLDINGVKCRFYAACKYFFDYSTVKPDRTYGCSFSSPVV